MRKTLTVIALAATIGAGALAATLPASASAPVNWPARTCTAFTAYQTHPGAASLASLVTDSTHLSRGWLKADIGQLYADASSPSVKAAKYAAKDPAYIAEDCA